MQTRNYETLFIVKGDTTEARLAEIVKKNLQVIEGYNGKLIHQENWGRRKFAYPIDKETRGQYIHLIYSANNEAVAEMERQMRISDDVLRFISVKLDPDRDPMKMLADFKVRLQAHAKREQERAERDAERNAQRAERRGGYRHDRYAPPQGNDQNQQQPPPVAAPTGGGESAQRGGEGTEG